MRTKILLGLALLVAIPLFARFGSVLEHPTDFLPFYCGGRAIAMRQNPYLTQPLWDCERNAIPVDDPRRDKMLIPAPLPPYALAFFALFAPLSFQAASLLWALINAVLIALTAVLLVRTMSFSLPIVLLALVPSEATLSIMLGQTVPIVLFALCVAAIAAQRGNCARVATAIGFSLVLPNVMLPAFLALFLFLPALRRPLLIMCAILALVSLVAVGPATCLEYATRVLPMHARADITNYEFQYSLTSVLWMFGVSVEKALGLGFLSYCLMSAAGIVLGIRLRRRFDDDRFLVHIPPAIALIGGIFVHAQELVIALPAALLLAYYLPGKRARTVVLAVSIFTLSLPWVVLPAIPAITSHFPAVATPTTPLTVLRTRPSDLAEIGWAHESAAKAILVPPNPLVEMIFKLPGWIGLLFLAGIAARMSAGARAVRRQVHSR
jgi:hypothetical protein